MLVPVLALNQSGLLTDNLPYECKDFLLFNHVVPHLLDISGRWRFIETAGAVSSCCLDCIRIIWGRILDFRCIAFFVLQHKTMQKMQCKMQKKKKTRIQNKTTWASETFFYGWFSVFLLVNFLQDEGKESSKSKNLQQKIEGLTYRRSHLKMACLEWIVFRKCNSNFSIQVNQCSISHKNWFDIA